MQVEPAVPNNILSYFTYLRARRFTDYSQLLLLVCALTATADQPSNSFIIRRV